MWRAVQVWRGIGTPLGAPHVDAARRIHWHALAAWNRALLDRGVVPPVVHVCEDLSALPCADAVRIAREGRGHPVAIAARRAAATGDATPPPCLGALDPSRVAYAWDGAALDLGGRELVDFALALSIAALTAWDEVLHREARAVGAPFRTIRESGVRYEAEPWPREEFLDSVEVRRRGRGDCEDLSSDRAAELRAVGHEARAMFTRRAVPSPFGVGEDVTLYHIIANSKLFGLEDPSRDLGMGKR